MYDSLQWVLVVAAIRRSSPLLLLLVSRQREHLELRESSSKKWLINWPATSGLLDPLYISIYTIFPLNPSPWPESWKRFANLLVSFSIVIGSRLFVLEFPPTHSTIPPARNIGEPATNLDSFPCSFLFPFFFFLFHFRLLHRGLICGREEIRNLVCRYYYRRYLRWSEGEIGSGR